MKSAMLGVAGQHQFAEGCEFRVKIEPEDGGHLRLVDGDLTMLIKNSFALGAVPVNECG